MSDDARDYEITVNVTGTEEEVEAAMVAIVDLPEVQRIGGALSSRPTDHGEPSPAG